MRFFAALLVLGIVVFTGSTVNVIRAEGTDEKIDEKDLPEGALAALKKLFPDAEVVGAAKEIADGKTVYEVEMKSKGKTIDVMLDATGKLTTVERQIDAKDLPKAVSSAVTSKYPKGVWKKIEEVSQFKDGKQKLDCYELMIGLTGERNVPIKVSLDGKITEEQPE